MKPPAEYHAPWVQDRIIAEGTRDQIIAWLCWNDPNGVYRDQDSTAEGYAALTRDRAADIMRSQIGPHPLETVIPRISDKAANDANIAGIDRLVHTDKYRHVVA